MGFFNYKRKVQIVHIPFMGVEFHCKMKIGELIIKCNSMPSNKHIIILPIFDVRIGRSANLGYGDKDFRDDLCEIIEIIESKDMGENAFFYAFDEFIKTHIKKYNRLVDTDLFRIVAEFILMMKALSKQSNMEFSENDRIEITKVFINRALKNFSDSYYVTRYKANGLNLEPYLDKYIK